MLLIGSLDSVASEKREGNAFQDINFNPPAFSFSNGILNSYFDLMLSWKSISSDFLLSSRLTISINDLI